MRARTVEFAAPRLARIVEVDRAEPREDEIAVRTLYSGISSGTELLAYRGEIDSDLVLDEAIDGLGATFSYPFRYGYSCVGIVEESNSDELPPGTMVFAFHPHQDHFVCAAADAVAVSGVDPRFATMFGLVETAFQVSLDADQVAGETVIVSGLGVVGLLTSWFLRSAGAVVVAVDPSAPRRAAAADLGFESTVPGEALDRALTTTSGRGVPLVVEASGAPGALSAALPMLAHEGTVLVASWYGSKAVTLDLGREFHRRRLTIRSSQVSTIPARLSSRWTIARRRMHVAGVLEELPLKRLATDEFPFERAPEAFAALDATDGRVIHVALSYGQD